MSDLSAWILSFALAVAPVNSSRRNRKFSARRNEPAFAVQYTSYSVACAAISTSRALILSSRALILSLSPSFSLSRSTTVLLRDSASDSDPASSSSTCGAAASCCCRLTRSKPASISATDISFGVRDPSGLLPKDWDARTTANIDVVANKVNFFIRIPLLVSIINIH